LSRVLCVPSRRHFLAGDTGFRPVGGAWRLGRRRPPEHPVSLRGRREVHRRVRHRGPHDVVDVAVRGLTLAEQQVVGLALDPLAGLEAESLGAGTPPAAGQLTSGFAGLDVVAGSPGRYRRGRVCDGVVTRGAPG
jgi:hypothetical protein